MNAKGKAEVFFGVMGFLVAPLVLGILLPFLTPLGDRPASFHYFLSAALIFYIASLSAQALFALPAFVLLRKYNLAVWWSAIVVGALVGVGVVALLAGRNAFFSTYMLYGGTGATGAVVFWLIWRWGRRLSTEASASPFRGKSE